MTPLPPHRLREMEGEREEEGRRSGGEGGRERYKVGERRLEEREKKGEREEGMRV